MKANCASAGLTSFSADKVTPTCLVLLTDYHILWEFSFRQLSTLQSSLLGVFPWECKEKIKKIKKNQMLNLWIDLENFKVLFLRNSRELGFLCDCIIWACSSNVLKYVFIMLLSFSIPVSYFPSYFVFISMVDNSWSTEPIRCRMTRLKTWAQQAWF